MAIVRKEAQLVELVDRLYLLKNPLDFVVHDSDRPIHNFTQVELSLTLWVHYRDLDCIWHAHQMFILLSEGHFHLVTFKARCIKYSRIFEQIINCCIGNGVIVEAQSCEKWPSNRLKLLPKEPISRLCHHHPCFKV